MNMPNGVKKNFKRPKPYTKIYRKLDKVGSVLPQERTHKLVAQNQMVIMNIHKNNIVHNFLVIFKNIFVFTNTYMLAMTINEKRCHNFEGGEEGVYGKVWKEEK